MHTTGMHSKHEATDVGFVLPKLGAGCCVFAIGVNGGHIRIF
jgi:hypothetical protein